MIVLLQRLITAAAAGQTEQPHRGRLNLTSRMEHWQQSFVQEYDAQDATLGAQVVWPVSLAPAGGMRGVVGNVILHDELHDTMHLEREHVWARAQTRFRDVVLWLWFSLIPLLAIYLLFPQLQFDSGGFDAKWLAGAGHGSGMRRTVRGGRAATSRRRRAAGGKRAGWRGRLAPRARRRLRDASRECTAADWLNSRGFECFVAEGVVHSCGSGRGSSGSGRSDGVSIGGLGDGGNRGLATRRIGPRARRRRPFGVGFFPIWCLMLASAMCRLGEASNPGPYWQVNGDILSAAQEGPARRKHTSDFDDPDGECYPPEGDEYGGWGLLGQCTVVPSGPPSEADLVDITTEAEMEHEDISGDPVREHVNPAPYFIGAKEFCGPQHGRVFKLGELGLGYYLDVLGEFGRMAGATQARGVASCTASRVAVKISLDQLVPRETDSPAPRSHAEVSALEQDLLGAHPPWTGDREASRELQRGRRGRRRRGGEAFALPKECKLKDASHRRAGIWALDAVNANAWPRAAEHLASTAADIVMVQETRRGPRGKNAAEREAARLKWSASLAPGVVTQAGRISAGVAVGVRSHIGLADAKAATGNGAAAGRYIRRWAGCMCRGGVHLGCVYIRTSEGMSGANGDILQQVAEDLATIRGPWILAGDFNMTAADLEASGWLSLVGGVAIVPPSPSCNGDNIDFFVVSESMSHAAIGAAVIEGRCGIQPALGCAPLRNWRTEVAAQAWADRAEEDWRVPPPRLSPQRCGGGPAARGGEWQRWGLWVGP